jgi:hypothetical protein
MQKLQPIYFSHQATETLLGIRFNNPPPPPKKKELVERSIHMDRNKRFQKDFIARVPSHNSVIHHILMSKHYQMLS